MRVSHTLTRTRRAALPQDVQSVTMMRLRDGSTCSRHVRIVFARQWLERMHAEATSARGFENLMNDEVVSTERRASEGASAAMTE